MRRAGDGGARGCRVWVRVCGGEGAGSLGGGEGAGTFERQQVQNRANIITIISITISFMIIQSNISRW